MALQVLLWLAFSLLEGGWTVSVAAYRIRKRVNSMAGAFMPGGFWEDKIEARAAFEAVLGIIDEELEAEAERQFTRPINSDPVTDMAKEVK